MSVSDHPLLRKAHRRWAVVEDDVDVGGGVESVDCCFCDKHVHSCSSPPARSGVQQLGCCRTDHLSEAFELFRVGKVPELQRTGDCAELGCGDVLEEGAVEADHVLGTWRSVELERAPRWVHHGHVRWHRDRVSRVDVEDDARGGGPGEDVSAVLADGAPAVRVDSGCAQRELVVVADGAVPPCESVGGGLADVNVLARVDVFVERDRFVDIRTSAVDGDWGQVVRRHPRVSMPPTADIVARGWNRFTPSGDSAVCDGAVRGVPGSFRGLQERVLVAVAGHWSMEPVVGGCPDPPVVLQRFWGGSAESEGDVWVVGLLEDEGSQYSGGVERDVGCVIRHAVLLRRRRQTGGDQPIRTEPHPGRFRRDRHCRGRLAHRLPASALRPCSARRCQA